MKSKYLLIVFLLGLGLFAAQKAYAANISISTNVSGWTLTLWYGSNRNNVTPTWGNQGIWTGNLSYSGMPEGWYTWNVEQWPSGYRLVSISGDAYQHAGSASWSVTWAQEGAPPPPPPPPPGGQQDINGGLNVYSNINACFTIRRADDGRTWDACTPYESGRRGGTYTIEPQPVAGYQFPPDISPGATQSIDFGHETIRWDLTYNRPASPPSCSSAGPDGDTVGSTGSRATFAYGVSNASSVKFPTWSDVNGQDDIVWYSGANLGGGTWKVDIPIANHPGYGNVSVHVYMDGNGRVNEWCDTANFTKAPPTPTASISASPHPVAYNQPTLISWSSSNVDSCTAGGTLNTWQGSISPLSGSSWSPPLTANHTLTISCSGPGGPASASIPVYIVSPTADIKANGVDGSVTIDFNRTATIGWSSSSAGSCYAGGTQDTWQGQIGLSGSSESPRLKSTKTFTITCYGANGSTTSDSVVVNVRGGPLANIKANNSDGPVTINWDSKVTISWSTFEVTSCTATGTQDTWQGPIATSGSSDSPKLRSSKTFGISCVGTDGQTYTDSVFVEVVGGPASCSSGHPESTTTSKTSGSFSLFADGVSSNATQVLFPTWTDVSGQDDLYWYGGRKLNSNTWTTDVDLGRHAGTGHVNVHIYVHPGAVLCATANFYKVPSGKVEVKIDAGVSWTLQGPYKTYTGSGPVNLTDIPCGTYRLTPANRSGFDVSVAPSSNQELKCP